MAGGHVAGQEVAVLSVTVHSFMRLSSHLCAADSDYAAETAVDAKDMAVATYEA